MAKNSGRVPSSAGLGFEAKLWLTAGKLRNNMDAAEYKNTLGTADEIAAGPPPAGTKLEMRCRSCPAASPGAAVVPGCNY